MIRSLEALFVWQVEPLADCHDWETAWEAFRVATGGSVLLRAFMARAAIEHLALAGTRLGICRQGGETVAMALVRPDRFGVWQLFNTSQLPLGFWLQRPGVDLASALAALLPVLPGRPWLFEGLHLDPEILPRPADASRLRTVDYFATGTVVMPESVAAFHAGLDKKKMSEIQRRKKRAVEEMGAVTLDCVTEPAAVRAAVAEYAAMESRGWKGAEGTALALGGGQSAFYAEVLDGYARLGEARVYRLLFWDRPAAMQLAVIAGPLAVFLKTCHDEALGRYGPGVLLKWMIFEAFIENEPQVRRAEFYGPYIDVQRIWVSRLRRMYHLNCYRWPALASLHKVWNAWRSR